MVYPEAVPTPLQSQVDGLVDGFVQQATDWRSLAAMMAGGMAYRVGRTGALTAGTGRLASLGIGLSAEVTAFELTNRALQSVGAGLVSAHFEGHPQGVPLQARNLWRWEGQGGIRQGFLNSFITFGSLKGSARVAQGENVVVQHLLQDTGMVLGHQVSASFGITDRPQGTFAEQVLHAEATNLQMSAGMALAHSVAPGIQGLERGLDLSLRSILSTLSHSPHFGPAFAVAGLGKTDLEQFGGPKIILNSFDDTGDPRFPGNAGGGSGRADEISGAFQRVEQRYKIPFLQYLRRNIHS